MSKLIVQAIINKVKEVNKCVLLGVEESDNTPASQLRIEAAVKQYAKDNGGNIAWTNALHRALCSVLDVPYRNLAFTESGHPEQWAILKTKSGTKKNAGVSLDDGHVVLVCNQSGYVYGGVNVGPRCLSVSHLETPTKEEALAFVASLEQVDPSKFFAWFNTNIGVGALETL